MEKLIFYYLSHNKYYIRVGLYSVIVVMFFTEQQTHNKVKPKKSFNIVNKQIIIARGRDYNMVGAHNTPAKIFKVTCSCCDIWVVGAHYRELRATSTSHIRPRRRIWTAWRSFFTLEHYEVHIRLLTTQHYHSQNLDDPKKNQPLV